MAGAVARVIISSLWHRAKNMQYANNTDGNSLLAISTISTPVANNSTPNIFVVSHSDQRRLVHM